MREDYLIVSVSRKLVTTARSPRAPGRTAPIAFAGPFPFTVYPGRRVRTADLDHNAAKGAMLAVIDDASVDDLLSYPDCIGLMREALAALARKDVHLPLRTVVRPPVDGVMALMPSYVGGARPALGVKIVTIFHDNPERGLDAHQGVVLLLDPATGRPRAAVDASAITRIRTAAVSALATDLLARPDADDLALVGSGTQARAHLRSMACVRPLRRVRVVSRRRANSERFAAEMADAVGVEIEVCDAVADAVAGASLVVTVTNAAGPVVTSDMVAAGAHVNAVGSSVPGARELDSALMGRARVYADRLESLLNESGDYLMAARDGAITEADVVGELGSLVLGEIPGRGAADEVTVFTSLGLAVEDVVAARHVHEGWIGRRAARDARPLR